MDKIWSHDMRYLQWKEFNLCVDTITTACRNKEFSGVYGIPRGGICLAVALSHSLNIPFLHEPIPNSIIVDDVYETGETLNAIKHISGITAYVWVSKQQPSWWKAVEICKTNEWIVFPWENNLFAKRDEQNYRLERNQNQ